MLRGLNVADYTDEDVGLIFWATRRAIWAIPVTQNPRGDLLGHVYDHGRRYGDIDVRGYETNAHLPFHSDGCDLVGLLCLRRAKSGGLSSIVSSVTLHNEILRQHPEYLPPLYNGYHYIKREAALTDDPVTATPSTGVRRQGWLRQRPAGAQPDQRRLRQAWQAAASRLELAALDFLDSLAYDPAIHLDMDLQLGDMQLCNNLHDPAFAHRLRGLARTGATPPHDPALADLPRAPPAGRRVRAA